MNTPRDETEARVRQAHPERVGHLDLTTTTTPATPVRGEPVEPPPQSPPTPTPTFEPLHPNARWGLRLSNALACLLPVAGPSAVLLAMSDALGPPAMRLALWLALAALAFIAGWRLGDARHRATRYALDAAGLRIVRGVWWRTQTLVPRSRVQHTDIAHGPLDRRLGLATLKVHTAGTRLAQVTLAGLPEARALQLRDALVAASNDDG